ncbi:hypothetical protein DITRI_Ditri08aG0026300 [Diplodiscus trichospermus]
MLQDMIDHPPEQQLSIDDIPSPISGQIFCFSDDDLFSEALQNSEVTSSNCRYEESRCYNNNLSLTSDIETLNGCQDNNGNTNSATLTAATSSTSTTTSTNTTAIAATDNNNSNLSMIFDSPDEIDNDISASIDFSESPCFSVPPFLTQQDQFDLSLVQSQIQLANVAADGRLSQYTTDTVASLLGPPTLPSVFDEACLSSVPSYVPLNPSSPSCYFLGPGMANFMPAGAITAALTADSSGIFTGSILMGSEVLQPQDFEYGQGDNGGIFKPGNSFQGLSSENQQLVGGAAASSSTPLASEMSSLEDSTFNKVGKLSVEQRKEKIHRYMKKRNERNFSKKIKYACGKTLADSRARVRGRFAKNDDFCETPRRACSNHEEDDDDEIVVKEEEDMVDSSHINGVNSFKCNYPIQSWI